LEYEVINTFINMRVFFYYCLGFNCAQ